MAVVGQNYQQLLHIVMRKTGILQQQESIMAYLKYHGSIPLQILLSQPITLLHPLDRCYSFRVEQIVTKEVSPPSKTSRYTDTAQASHQSSRTTILWSRYARSSLQDQKPRICP